MIQKKYYTLMASLPHLPPLEQATTLPISWLQLQKRVSMLEEEDALLVEQIQKLFAWYYHPSSTRNHKIIQLYKELMHNSASHPHIQQIITDILNQRTIVTAFRMKYADMHFTQSEEAWGIQKDRATIERHWDQDDFKLGYEYPWVNEVKKLFTQNDPYGLTKLLMGLIYKKAEELKAKDPFTLEAFIAYLIQWANLQKWLSYEAKKATQRFDNLILEAHREYQTNS
jgi:hypothetical protein